MKSTLFRVFLVLPLAAVAFAQTPSVPPGPSLETATASVRKQLEESLAELSALRERMAGEKLPLARRLSELETELSKTRQEFQQVSRELDAGTLDLTNLRSEIKIRQDEANYLSNLLAEYGRNLEARLHVSELKRYAKELEAAKTAVENTALSKAEVFSAQLGLFTASLDRLHDALGGTRFPGRATDGNGVVSEGTFVLVGPTAIFRSNDGKIVGTAEQRLGSLEPTVVPFDDEAHAKAAAAVAGGAAGVLPLDPTLGNAQKIAATEETLWEHIKKGGAVMVPIFVLAAAALLVVLYKWIGMAFVRKPSSRRLKELLAAIADGDRARAMSAAEAVGGPTGRMLSTGVDHVEEPRELIEEVMYETVLATRLKLQRFLPFVAISASSAPLLGLLGTVTGIMTTFKLITVFGTGDVKTLSSGISEALITTEYGLIVAIPSLLIHALLSRKAKGLVDEMEKAGIAFMNQLAKTPFDRPGREAEPEAAETASAPQRGLPSVEVPRAAPAPAHPPRVRREVLPHRSEPAVIEEGAA